MFDHLVPPLFLLATFASSSSSSPSTAHSEVRLTFSPVSASASASASASVIPLTRTLPAALLLDWRWHSRFCSSLSSALSEHSSLYYASESAWTEADLVGAAAEDACRRVAHWRDVAEKAEKASPSPPRSDLHAGLAAQAKISKVGFDFAAKFAKIRLARFGGARNAAWRDLFSTAWRWRMDMARLDAAVARAVSVGRLSPALLDGGALHTLEKDVRSRLWSDEQLGCDEDLSCLLYSLPASVREVREGLFSISVALPVIARTNRTFRLHEVAVERGEPDLLLLPPVRVLVREARATFLLLPTTSTSDSSRGDGIVVARRKRLASECLAVGGSSYCGHDVLDGGGGGGGGGRCVANLVSGRYHLKLMDRCGWDLSHQSWMVISRGGSDRHSVYLSRDVPYALKCNSSNSDFAQDGGLLAATTTGEKSPSRFRVARSCRLETPVFHIDGDDGGDDRSADNSITIRWSASETPSSSPQSPGPPDGRVFLLFFHVSSAAAGAALAAAALWSLCWMRRRLDRLEASSRRQHQQHRRPPLRYTRRMISYLQKRSRSRL